MIGRKSQNQFFCTDGNVVVIGALAVAKGNKAHIDFAAGNQLLLSADICFNYVNDNIRILAVKKRINAGFNVAADAWNFERVPGVCRFPVSQGQNTFCPLHHENLINKTKKTVDCLDRKWAGRYSGNGMTERTEKAAQGGIF